MPSVYAGARELTAVSVRPRILVNLTTRQSAVLQRCLTNKISFLVTIVLCH